MKIERYSLYGFKPQIQKHHMKYVKTLILSDEEYLNYYFKNPNNSKILDIKNEYQKMAMLNIKHSRHDFLKEHVDDLKEGIWAFIAGHKDNMSLNHLKVRVPRFYAEIPDDTIVYDVNWEKTLKITDEECLLFGFYIPKKELKKLTILTS